MQNCRKPIPTPYREYSVPGRNNPPRYNSSDLSDYPLAMAYIPWQRWSKTYPLEEALDHGTLFPDLYKPLSHRTGGEKHECR